MGKPADHLRTHSYQCGNSFTLKGEFTENLRTHTVKNHTNVLNVTRLSQREVNLIAIKGYIRVRSHTNVVNVACLLH